MGNKKTFLIIEILLILIIPVFFGTLLFITPFTGDLNLIDEGQFAAWTNHMMHGKLMYRDIYITYGPLFVWPLFLLFKIFGPSAFLVHGFLLYISPVFSSLILVFVINNFSVPKITRLMMVLSVLVFPGINIRMGVAYLTILLLIYSRRSDKFYPNFLLGASCVFAFLVSPETGVFSFLIVFLHILYDHISLDRLSDALRKSCSVFAGIIVCFLLFVFWAVSEKWFGSYVATTFDVFVSFSGINLPNGQKYPNPFTLFPRTFDIFSWIRFLVSQNMLLYWQAAFYLAVYIYLGIRKFISRFDGNDYILFLINSYAIFLYVTLIGKHGGYYFTFTPILIFLAYFIPQLLEKVGNVKPKRGRVTAVLLIVFFALFLVRLTLFFRPHFNRVLNVPASIFAEKSRIERIGAIQLSEEQNIYILGLQEFINQNTDKNDYVFIMTNEPFMYMLFDKLNPTRYDLPYVAATIEKRHEMLNDIKRRKPVYVIEDIGAWKIDGISNRDRLPEVFEFIKSNYIVESRIGNVILYKYLKKPTY